MGKTIQVFGFPSVVPAETVTKFLECFTGQGTVYALEVKQSKGGNRAYAKVQFTNDRSAEYIMALAKKRLNYGSSYLRAWEMDIDLVPRARSFEHNMEKIVLHFGCQLSKNRFSVLRNVPNVSIRFGIGMKKMYFILRFLSLDYKLELSNENIWQIVLHRRSQAPKFLVIQLFGAPRVFKKLEESTFSYFKETPDDQWVRTTDFTSSCIGQSSGICLELPRGIQLPNLGDYFAWFKESDSQFFLETGSPYSYNLVLAPILQPPQGLYLPYEILFKVCCLVQTGCLPGPSLDANFFRLVDPRRIEIRYIEHALEDLYVLKDCCYEPVQWLKEQYAKYDKLQRLPKSPTLTLEDGLVYVRRVQVTPCKVYFCGPEVNVSNRVLRHFSEDIDNFLRVSFIDEEWNKMFSTDLSPRIAANENGRTEIYERILSTLKNGIVIGDKKFEFLAFSSSQLRDNSVWMFASRPGLTAADIRTWMGDFSRIRNVAKYAARLGQSFSSSTETLNVGRHEIEMISDIEVRGGYFGTTKYVFSDGIGKMSAQFARQVATKCGLSFTPSAFQIRYGGFKGVVAVDPTSSKKLSLRESMMKYESDNTKLDVLAWSKYQPCFLNRQLITLLSTLGVKDVVFEKKQREAVAQLDTILTDPLRAHEALELMAPGENTNVLKEMLKCGYKPDSEPFLSMMLQTFRASKLLDLRTKTRIFIPDGRSMIGCLDETRTLEYGQVFVQFSSAGRRQFYDDSISYYEHKNILKGTVVVAKNPCLHPGDIRILKAVDLPALHHMVDCVVFPQKGKRPHTNECSGSDLDGDIYFVCWDPDLIPPRQDEPMDYTPAPTVQLDHEVTIEEVEEYFTNYIVNDSLGIIANAHTVFADRELLKARSKPCLELAQLFSIAVDFPKTGVPAEIPSHLRVKEYPDFMEKSDKTTYDSQHVIGKLFREVKEIAPHTSSIRSFTREVARKSYDTDLEVDGFEDYVDEAFDYKSEYDYKLGNLMDYYGIKTEAEILSGGIMKMSRSFDRRKDAEAVGMAVRSLRKEARTWFNRNGGHSDDAFAKASAWYHVTYHPRYWGCYNEGLNRAHYISFPWCIYDRLIQIKKARTRRAQQPSSLEVQFNHRLRLY
ncbi:probable RNA-dependent RNA polymerase 1 [Coffea eugenioides]|uniref:probable RNA-dependent RNA polymerase 1 n=1 Tax=Coffea eugenioides TaxID=49369 RepID=UPI000F60E103|nr:probable RNA-dependent RNA polymerase 1 [Coffea eugenioides]XP_027151355.1 probable RNA-dependent RNA polymerase 1 [Coffea eugenioides]